ncbi:peptidoglycan-associated lipoprotein Pal [Sphingomonadales bacterium 56]|uniref:Peptidoglycan-associated lipoprotein n=1 Tax=Sphingobium agri TaxID=2933566 RepID=A0ABT0DYS1_9SPHN|nr:MULTISPECIES: peptidoglycan-associated lipoprotein Pal [Sphingobium]MBY2929002.1 peptidoglycan-associated lipoprotein Pal [Sphingomonadales bacterium 56]MBY2959146.1 peptidoglycan-associated lipoprotein Pal [Sphingomonadales bacterium 58]MCK0532275.1 peptidoglycan-associated lipoprotein Pal [Sphingobium agri]CAD7338344.1 Peptidoglycan-associated lipoprotein [Sphingobium sp. S6]CAD7338625.1 Peptidoglycan-associated lipoprotein [Sphingobium sp. S8]
MKLNRPLLIAVSVLALAACGKKAPKDLPPPPATDSSAQTGTGTGTGTGAPVKGSQEDFVASVSSDRIFFDTDQYDVDAQDQQTLQSQAAWLQQNPNVRVTIEGHADERGTRDYNIALGDRRANAAKNYLASLGIDPSRINTVSYGKERPAALGSDESAWAQNRRAVTVTVQY